MEFHNHFTVMDWFKQNVHGNIQISTYYNS